MAKKKAQKKSAVRVMKTLERGAAKIARRIEQIFTTHPISVTSAIKTDHEALRTFIKILKDADRPLPERRKAYAQFADLLHSHTVAEQTAVYKPTHRLPGHEMHIKVAEGVVEHDLSEDLMKRIARTRDPLAWSAHCNVLAEIVEHHLKEEERDLLPMIDKIAPDPTKNKMLEQFLALRGKTQKLVTPKNAGVLEQI